MAGRAGKRQFVGEAGAGAGAEAGPAGGCARRGAGVVLICKHEARARGDARRFIATQHLCVVWRRRTSARTARREDTAEGTRAYTLIPLALTVQGALLIRPMLQGSKLYSLPGPENVQLSVTLNNFLDFLFVVLER